MRRRRRLPIVPDHPLTDALAEMLLPHVSEYAALDRREHARGIARLVLNAYERRYRQEMKGAKR